MSDKDNVVQFKPKSIPFDITPEGDLVDEEELVHICDHCDSDLFYLLGDDMVECSGCGEIYGTSD